MQLNPLTREVLIKLVYYGPGLGGKTTSLQCVHRAAPPETRGQLVSLATPVDRTLYFDFLPLRVPPLREHHVRLQLFTVPGQVYFNATRKLVLTGADGVAFVADSQEQRKDANVESLENLAANLEEQGRSIGTMPLVVQYNKRDLPDVASIAALDDALNPFGAPSFATCAIRGEGVIDALDTLVRLVLDDLEARGQLGKAVRPTAEVRLGREDPALADHIGRASEQVLASALPRVTLPIPPSTLGGADEQAPQGLGSNGGYGERPAPVRRTGGVSFASLFSPGVDAQAASLEGDLAAGRLTRVIAQADRLVAQLLAATAERGGLASADPALVALMLGVDGERWFSFRRVVQRVHDGGPVSERDALAAYGLVIDVQLRLDRAFGVA